MVISSRPLVELVPVQPAAMAGRQLCQWDKDSCADAGFLKIDLLGLGMLSAVEDCVEQIARLHGEPIDLSRIPSTTGRVRGDPGRRHRRHVPDREPRPDAEPLRTRPETLDDLTVQVALVRPGPIQGKAVHPYIEPGSGCATTRSTSGRSTTSSSAGRSGSTYGVVVFQDQVLESRSRSPVSASARRKGSAAQ